MDIFNIPVGIFNTPLWGIMVSGIIVWLCLSIKIINEMERAVIFRLGEIVNVLGPGLIIVFWPIDKMIKVNLSKEIPSWQQLSKEELISKVKEAAAIKGR